MNINQQLEDVDLQIRMLRPYKEDDGYQQQRVMKMLFETITFLATQVEELQNKISRLETKEKD